MSPLILPQDIGLGVSAWPMYLEVISLGLSSPGQVSVVTGEIERFLSTGILLKSGEVLEADIVITATGFHMSVMGDVVFTVDGKPLDFAETITFHGMMFTGVPNLAGYLAISAPVGHPVSMSWPSLSAGSLTTWKRKG